MCSIVFSTTFINSAMICIYLNYSNVFKAFYNELYLLWIFIVIKTTYLNEKSQQISKQIAKLARRQWPNNWSQLFGILVTLITKDILIEINSMRLPIYESEINNLCKQLMPILFQIWTKVLTFPFSMFETKQNYESYGDPNAAKLQIANKNEVEYYCYSYCNLIINISLIKNLRKNDKQTLIIKNENDIGQYIIVNGQSNQTYFVEIIKNVKNDLQITHLSIIHEIINILLMIDKNSFEFRNSITKYYKTKMFNITSNQVIKSLVNITVSKIELFEFSVALIASLLVGLEMDIMVCDICPY